MAKLIAKGAAGILILLVTANIMGCGQTLAQPPSELFKLTPNYDIVNILGIDPTTYPKIKVNIFVDELCAATGNLVKNDFMVEEDGVKVAIDNFYFTGRASGQKLDLVVVFDETDTMAEEIDEMQSKVDDLTNKIGSSNIDARYSLVTFKDEVSAKIEWTNDADIFKREVDLLRASGGNYQRPEDSIGGVAKALSFGFRPDAQKIIIVITDEPSLQRGDGWSDSPYHKDDIQQDLVDAGVMLVAVSPDFRVGTIPSNIPRSDLPLYADMRELAQNSGGLWIGIYSADFSVILDKLEEIITGTYVIEYTSRDAMTAASRTVSVSVNAPECIEGGTSSTYVAPAMATVQNEPPVVTDLTSDKMSPQEADLKITWTAAAEDPNRDPILYRFFLDGEPMTDWIGEKVWTWTASEEGAYQIEVHVRDGMHAGPSGMDNRKVVSFDITGPDETEVIFPDPNLEAAVRNAIDRPHGPIYVADLEQVDTLRAVYSDIKDLSGMEYCTNLETLDILQSKITDISPLAGLTNLELLWLGGNQITDISPLAGLTNLEDLNLAGNQIADVSPLAGLTNLEKLYLGNNEITDISPLTGLTNLNVLHLSYNRITDISPLARLTNLKSLDLPHNQITDVSPLAGLTNLEYLDLAGNRVTDVSPLAGLSNLEVRV